MSALPPKADSAVQLGGSVHREQPHPPVANVDLQPVAIVFEFMHPALATRRALRDGRTAGMDEGGGGVFRPPRDLRTRHNIRPI
jgi:hypothetical protein